MIDRPNNNFIFEIGFKENCSYPKRMVWQAHYGSVEAFKMCVQFNVDMHLS